MSDFNYIEYLKNNPLFKGDTSKLITESQEEPKSSKMKKSELKAKIKEQILATLSEEEVSEEIELSEDEFLAVDEAKKDEEAADEEMDTEVDADMTADTEMAPANPGVGLSSEEQEIQNNLKMAYDNAVAIGDQKLADQIGNSITFFTRSHVVER